MSTQPQSWASYFIGSGWQSSLTTLMSNFCSAAQPRKAEFYRISIMKVISISCGYFVFNPCHFVVVSNYSSYIRHIRDVDWLQQKACNKLQSDCQAVEQTFPMFTSYSNNSAEASHQLENAELCNQQPSQF